MMVKVNVDILFSQWQNSLVSPYDSEVRVSWYATWCLYEISDDFTSIAIGMLLKILNSSSVSLLVNYSILTLKVGFYFGGFQLLSDEASSLNQERTSRVHETMMRCVQVTGSWLLLLIRIALLRPCNPSLKVQYTFIFSAPSSKDEETPMAYVVKRRVSSHSSCISMRLQIALHKTHDRRKYLVKVDPVVGNVHMAKRVDFGFHIVSFDEGRNGLWVMNTPLQTGHDILLTDHELPTILGGESDWDCCISYGSGCGKGRISQTGQLDSSNLYIIIKKVPANRPYDWTMLYLIMGPKYPACSYSI
ncbi:hypothetical protein VNO77_33926 [Canavalia gladiata]|uniref:Uncharacterized protein n=1 Tax=Canavalia gladiata TaxID=3824 RepID=A0AAN9PWT5_CANGL